MLVLVACVLGLWLWPRKRTPTFEQLDEEAARIRLRDQELWDRAKREGKISRSLDDEMIGSNAHRLRIKAWAGEVVSRADERARFTNSYVVNVKTYLEYRPAQDPAQPAKVWGLTRAEETLLVPEPVPVIRRIFDYRDLSGSPVAFRIRPALLPTMEWIVNREEKTLRVGKNENEGSRKALAAYRFLIPKDWVEYSKGQMMLWRETKHDSPRCFRMAYHFGTEELNQPDTRQVQILIAHHPDAQGAPRIAYDELRSDAGFAPDDKSFHEPINCTEVLEQQKWDEAVKGVLGSSGGATSKSGWSCNLDLNTPGSKEPPPLYLIYVQTPYPGCLSIDETRKAVRREYKDFARW